MSERKDGMEREARELAQRWMTHACGDGNDCPHDDPVDCLGIMIAKFMNEIVPAAEFATEKDCLKVVQKAYYEAYAKSDRLNMRVCAAIEKHMKESQGEPHLNRALAACANEARLEALEQAAVLVEAVKISSERIRLARAIRALKAESVPPPKPAREGG